MKTCLPVRGNVISAYRWTKRSKCPCTADQVAIRTISGRDARDDGSECNAPMPDHDIVGFQFEVMDSRKGIRLVAEPRAATASPQSYAFATVRAGKGSITSA